MASKQPIPFEGFSKELPEFLWGIAFNNEKPWFEAHREQYERCLNQPFRAFAREICDRMEELFPGRCSQLHISRIYRDARRLYGRGPYNDHLWFSLGATGQLYDVRPKFWFGIDAKSYELGMGMWGARGELMDRWRREIDEHPERLSKIVRNLNKHEGLERWGDVYKRPKGDPGKLLFDWYNTKTPAVGKTVYFDPDPPGGELVEEVLADFAALMPLYEYMMEISVRGD